MIITRPALSVTSETRPVNALPVHNAEALTQGGNQAFIQLNDQTYTLRITKLGKLILTK
ncbi:hemin uptake protein HemP [Cochlodiniinecator piscidefendens]|uniref:hemin uptake protein HemP n=1 Tax=Cochlodiniinecator piscidefendens TaxID=2715756 RepID=UPI00140CC16E|nr:hemin uptake protein HemP [Cochlodiniinecator piscidefendens]